MPDIRIAQIDCGHSGKSLMCNFVQIGGMGRS